MLRMSLKSMRKMAMRNSDCLYIPKEGDKMSTQAQINMFVNEATSIIIENIYLIHKKLREQGADEEVLIDLYKTADAIHHLKLNLFELISSLGNDSDQQVIFTWEPDTEDFEEEDEEDE